MRRRRRDRRSWEGDSNSLPRRNRHAARAATAAMSSTFFFGRPKWAWGKWPSSTQSTAARLHAPRKARAASHAAPLCQVSGEKSAPTQFNHVTHSNCHGHTMVGRRRRGPRVCWVLVASELGPAVMGPAKLSLPRSATPDGCETRLRLAAVYPCTMLTSTFTTAIRPRLEPEPSACSHVSRAAPAQ